MKQKKNKGLKIAIIILIIIILLIGVISYLYFFTDLFKSNKQLFFKYAAQLVQTENGYLDDNLIQYLNKKNNTSYENNGNLSFEINDSELQSELVNDFNVSFSGKVDPNNLKTEEEISLIFSDDVNIPLTYRQTNNIIGIQTKYIGSNFVALRQEEESSAELEQFNKIIELENIEISEQEIQNLKTAYFDNILNNLDDNKFAKIEEQNLTGYRLTVTGEEFKNILVQILETLKTDENTMNKINQLLGVASLEIDSDYITDLQKDINDELELNDNVEMTIYTNEGNLKEIDILIEGNTIIINKEKNGQELTYNISIDNSDESGKVSFVAKYTNLNSDSITEDYELTLEGNFGDDNTIDSYKYVVTNNVQFQNSVEIEDLTEENAVILNDKDEEYINNLIIAIQERITEVNQITMEELGVSENENPIQYLIPSTLLSGGAIEISEQDVNAFNSKFELYESTNTKGATVKGLLTTIQNNNETEDNYKIEEINIDGEEYDVTEQNITFIKSNINVDDNYKVEFERDIDTGLIYRAVINKK